MKSIIILYGGPSSEYEVSKSSKDYFYNLLKDYNPVLVEWTKDSNFIIENKICELKEFLEYAERNNALVVNSLHGEFGEDGYIQEILSLNQILFTGSDSKSSMVSTNKYETDLQVRDLVNTIPTYKTLPKNFDYNLCKKYIGAKFPIFAKPNNLGSSVGTVKIHNHQELKSVLSNLKDIEYLFQPFIKGTEVSVGVVIDKNKFIDMPITEIIPHAEYFNYESKYSDNGTKEVTPARISDELTTQIKELSKNIHNKLNLGFYSRVDFLISENKIYFLEINSLPGMAKASILPQQLAKSNNIEIFKKGLIKNFIPTISTTHLLDIPYYSQMTVNKHNDIIRKNEWNKTTEGHEESGAKSLKHFLEYSDNLCGSACIKMIFEYFGLHKKLFKIFYELEENGFYKNIKDVGLNYENLNNFFNKYNLQVQTYRTGLTVDEICRNLLEEKLSVVSIRPLNEVVKSKQINSGHLVLATGFNLEKQCLYINDPGGSFKNNEQKNRELSFEEFRKVYSYKGFCVSA